MKKLMLSSLLAAFAVVLLPGLPSVGLAADPAVAGPSAGSQESDAAAPAPEAAGGGATDASEAAVPAKKKHGVAPKKGGKGAKAGKARAGAKTAGKSDEDKAAAKSTIPQDVRDEMGKLIEDAIQVASPELQKSDHFLPYGVLRLDDGSLKVLRWQMPTAPSDLAVLGGMVRAMQVEALKNPHVVAGVTVATTQVPTVDGKTMVSGIRAEVDHRRGLPQIVFIPYTKENGKLILGTLVYAPGVNPLFDHGPMTPPAGSKPAAAPGAAAATTEPATAPAAASTAAPAAAPTAAPAPAAAPAADAATPAPAPAAP